MQHDFELCIQKVPRCLPKQACIWLRQSAVTRSHLLKKNGGKNPKFFYLFYLFQHSHICISIAVGQSWYIRLSSKSLGKIAITSCYDRTWTAACICSGFHYESRQVSVMTTGGIRKTHPNAIMISCCHSDDTSVAFNRFQNTNVWKTGAIENARWTSKGLKVKIDVFKCKLRYVI